MDVNWIEYKFIIFYNYNYNYYLKILGIYGVFYVYDSSSRAVLFFSKLFGFGTVEWICLTFRTKWYDFLKNQFKQPKHTAPTKVPELHWRQSIGALQRWKETEISSRNNISSWIKDILKVKKKFQLGIWQQQVTNCQMGWHSNCDTAPTSRRNTFMTMLTTWSTLSLSLSRSLSLSLSLALGVVEHAY